ncbi:type I restriction-modification enzyme R subunit C-terminal domain-containing protein [Planctellipticum variicoloris]|uniref:type I restriction-modification enzyme R subunit C-terminal domain-containing protein n=1 Tax=Planctellipticum variicoloris TaxID=3064265 RepID=UPI003013C332|nr:hypothetical protein SH412_004849 [Planctomycetaceae bacterium SH412]
MNEADTCRTLVRPKLETAGWDGNKHFYSEQTAFTDGRIIVPAGEPRRHKKRFSDFLLRYTRDVTLAVVEAKSNKRPAGDGLQKARDYASILGLKFAFATNGTDIKPESDDATPEPRKYYVHGGLGGIDTEVTMDLDADGSKLRTVQITLCAADTVKTPFTAPDALRQEWSDFEQRSAVVEMFEERGIDFDELASHAGHLGAAPFDLLCHLAFNAPLLTRKQRAEKLRTEEKDFFDQFGPEAKTILDELLDQYAEHGTSQFLVPDVLQVPPLSSRGNVIEFANTFGRPEQLLAAIKVLQQLLYAA